MGVQRGVKGIARGARGFEEEVKGKPRHVYICNCNMCRRNN
jgi:hypothetical protein